jgi:acyl-CoA synthetase (NDP forming)
MFEKGDGHSLEVNGEKVPAYLFPEAAGRVLGKVAAYGEWRRRPLGLVPDFEDLDIEGARAVCSQVLRDRGPGWLTLEEIGRILQAVRLPAVPGGLARTADEAVDLAGKVGFPVAVKLSSAQLTHKTDVGGVHLNVADPSGVREAFLAIRRSLERTGQLQAMDGVWIQPMISEGVEVIVGVTEDPVFGPLVAFGLGGIQVEVMGDVQFRINPLTDQDARELVRGIKGYRLLNGFRGQPPADVEALEEVLLRVSRLVDEVPEITDLDFNPVITRPAGQGCVIVDARIRVDQAGKQEAF